jgi:undecaprenyl pyrophosphate phosphatase UppP
MSAPVIAGAGLHHVPTWIHEPAASLSLLPSISGFLASVLSSYLTIKFLLRFLQHHTFIPFAAYRLLLAAVILISIFYFNMA